jgi:Zn-dependent M28 family amino/carboxypeptidase
LTGTLGNQVGIPVVGATFQVGRELYNLVRSGALVRLRVAVNSKTTPVETFNVIGEKRGRIGKVVLAGAHLDSVPEGPGINDNGSGSATLLTIVEAMAKLQTQPYNTVRFAFWGAEEAGLFGSSHYVSALSQAALDRIALNLNFDMLGSPNYVRFVYDGDGSIGDAGPPGSEVIEQVFVNYFKARGLPTEPTEFDGRSDYLAFIEAGIPAGGLFSGAEDKKTVRQARLYGGTAGVPYDRCYHKACDDLSNVSDRAIRELGKASAHAVLTFAMTKEDISAAGPATVQTSARTHEYRGPHLVR